jgi:hypothetical protein
VVPGLDPDRYLRSRDAVAAGEKNSADEHGIDAALPRESTILTRCCRMALSHQEKGTRQMGRGTESPDVASVARTWPRRFRIRAHGR